MRRPHSITWITHSREHTTLLGQHTLKSQQLYLKQLDHKKLYTTLHLDVQHCNRILLVQYSLHIFNKEVV